jgi:hypothetical protein
LELRHPVGQDRDAALAGAPVARRQIVQDLGQTVLGQLLGQLVLVVSVGEEILDPGEAGLGRGGKSVEEIDLVEHHGQVGREIRHVSSP